MEYYEHLFLKLLYLMEHLLMLFLATTVGGLVIAMYLPIFQMAGNI